MALDRRRFSIPARELLRAVPAWECHLHTDMTDGSATIEACARKACDLGLTRIIFTEHTEGWKSSRRNWFDAYLVAVRKTAEAYAGRMEIVAGIEAPALDFNHTLDLGGAVQADIPFILGAAHRYPGLNGRRVKELSPAECIELEYKTLLSLARNPMISSIAHLGGTCRRYCSEFPDDLTAKVIRTARDNGIAIELNSRYHVPLSPILSICLQENAHVTIGSDAHSLNEIGTGCAAVATALEELNG
ncbi:MAG: PHP domain-containing protein [Thermodesulfobacteriota bacterium]